MAQTRWADKGPVKTLEWTDAGPGRKKLTIGKDNSQFEVHTTMAGGREHGLPLRVDVKLTLKANAIGGIEGYKNYSAIRMAACDFMQAVETGMAEKGFGGQFPMYPRDDAAYFSISKPYHFEKATERDKLLPALKEVVEAVAEKQGIEEKLHAYGKISRARGTA